MSVQALAVRSGFFTGSKLAPQRRQQVGSGTTRAAGGAVGWAGSPSGSPAPPASSAAAALPAAWFRRNVWLACRRLAGGWRQRHRPTLALPALLLAGGGAMPSNAGAGGRDCECRGWAVPLSRLLGAACLVASWLPGGVVAARSGCVPAQWRAHHLPLLQGPGKKWEHTETNQNGKPVRVSMHVRKGDTVKVRMWQPAGSRERAARGGLAGLRQQQPFVPSWLLYGLAGVLALSQCAAAHVAGAPISPAPATCALPAAALTASACVPPTGDCWRRQGQGGHSAGRQHQARRGGG